MQSARCYRCLQRLPNLPSVLFRFSFRCSIAIGKAFSVLSDPKKREQYDQYGQAMEPQYHRSGHTGGRQQYYYYEDDDDFSAEEIFNMFFGQGVATRAHRRRHQPHSFHFATNSTQNVCSFFSLVSSNQSSSLL